MFSHYDTLKQQKSTTEHNYFEGYHFRSWSYFKTAFTSRTRNLRFTQIDNLIYLEISYLTMLGSTTEQKAVSYKSNDYGQAAWFSGKQG